MQTKALRSCLTLLLLAMPAAWADESDLTVNQWLDRMSMAVESLDYRGTLIQIRGGQMGTFEVIRRVDDDAIRERVYALDGPPQEMIREGNQFRSTIQGNRSNWFYSDLRQRLIPHQPVNQMAGLNSAYEMRLGGIDRVAGYEAQRIDIWPRDAFRYGQQLWLELQTGMLLRSRMLNAQGQVLVEQVFVKMEMGTSISDRDLEPQTARVFDAPAQKNWQQPESDANPEAIRMSGLLRPLWGPRQLPAHFQLINADHGRSDLDSAFDHLLFSDGLTSFSVYIDHAPIQPVETQLDSMGTVHVFTGMMGQRQFTIMGQVPAQTVEFVGRQFLAGSERRER